MANDCTLFLSNLNPLTTEVDIKNLFGAANMTKCVVIMDKNTKKSREFGYATFVSPEAARKAYTEKNQVMLRSKHINIQLYKVKQVQKENREANLLIKNVTPDVSVDTIYEALQTFGTIESFKWCSDDKGKSLGYGFIQYSTKEEADRAVKAVDCVIFHGKKVRLIYHKTRAERQTQPVIACTNIYVNNFLQSDTDEIKKTFENIGKVASFSIKFSEKHKKYFGFFCYQSSDDAQNAIKLLNDTIVSSGNKLMVCQAKKKDTYYQEQRETSMGQRRKLHEETKNRNLYVKGLPHSWQTSDLYNLFKKFGEIESCKVAVDHLGLSRRFGFVCFKSEESAKKAKNEKLCTEDTNKSLFVDFFQTREERNYNMSTHYYKKDLKKENKPDVPQPSQFPIIGHPFIYPGYPNMDQKQFAFQYRNSVTPTAIKGPVSAFISQLPQLPMYEQQMRAYKQYIDSLYANHVKQQHNTVDSSFQQTNPGKVASIPSYKHGQQQAPQNPSFVNQLKHRLQNDLKQEVPDAFIKYLITRLPKGVQIEKISQDELQRLYQEFYKAQ